MKNIFKIILFVVVLTTPLFAVDEIFTWGYGRQMHDLLRAVAALTGSTNDSLIKTAVGIGMLVLTLRLAANGQNAFMDIIKFIGMTIFVTQLFWTQKGDFIVKDQTNNFLSPAVLQLPYGVGMTFSLFSKLENGVGQAFETNFSTPNSISYQKAGLGFMMSAHLGMDSLTTSDPSLVKTFNEYLDNCLLNSAAMGNLDISNLKSSTDLINALEVNEAWLTPVYTGTAAGVMMDCKGAWGNIKARIPGDASNGVSVFAKSFGQLSAGDVTSKLGDVAQTMFGNAAISSSSYINQMSLMNMYSEGMQAVALSTASDLSAVATASAIAQSSTKAGWIQAGLQAKRTLPMQKAFLTMMSVVMLMLMSLYAIAIVDFSGIKQMFQLLFVYTLWTPLTIVINYLMYSTIESVASGMTGNNLPTLLSKAAISNETQSYLAFLGYAVALVTGMAFALVTKNGYSFAQAVSSAGMSASSLKAAETAGGLGSFSHGNVGIQNTSVGNTSKFGMSYYGNEIAGQGDGYSISIAGGIMQTSSAHSGTHRTTKGGGIVDATFEGNKATDVSVKGLNAKDIINDYSKSLSESISDTKTVIDSTRIAAADTISSAWRSAKTESDKTAVAKSFGLSYEKAETISKAVEEAEAVGYKEAQAKTSTNSKINYTGSSVTLNSGVGTGKLGGGIVKANLDASLYTGNKEENTDSTSNSTQNTFDKTVKETKSKVLADAIRTNESLRKDIEHSLTTSLTTENSKTHSDTYELAKTFQAAQTKNEVLQMQESLVAGVSQNINVATFERLAEKHGADTADKKADLWEKMRNEIVLHGNQATMAEFKEAATEIMKERGLEIMDTSKVEANIKKAETSVNGNGGGAESVIPKFNLPISGANDSSSKQSGGFNPEFTPEQRMALVKKVGQSAGKDKNKEF